MRYFLTTLLLSSYIVPLAQKPTLDTAALAAWPHIDDETISGDGNYVFYSIQEDGRSPTLCLQSTNDSFKLEIPGGDLATFTEDSRRFIFMKTGDSLCIVDLIVRKTEFKTQVVSYQLPKEGRGRWLGYKLSSGVLIVDDLLSNKAKEEGRVLEYLFSNKGEVLVMQRKVDFLNEAVQLEWVDLEKGYKKIIYHGEGISNMTISDREDRLAFLANRVHGEKASPLLYWYNAGEDSAQMIVDDGVPGMEAGYKVEPGELEFSTDEQRVFFLLRHVPPLHPPRRIGASVDVWNYKDRFLPSQRGVDVLEVFKAVYNSGVGKVVRLQEETDGFMGMAIVNHAGNDNYLLTATNYNSLENLFQDSNRSTLYLINTDDGSRIVVARNVFFPLFAEFSPCGRYVFWYDEPKKAYFAYDIQLKKCRNVSFQVPVSLADERDGVPGPPNGFGWAMWLPQDGGLLVYDHYDIWKLDPQGVTPPLDVTRGFGRRNKIVLRCSFFSDEVRNRKEVITDEKGALVLCALDEGNKNNGFYKLAWRSSAQPEKLCMGRAMYYFSGSSSFVTFPAVIKKARHAQKYLLSKMSIAEYPNKVITEDFRSFSAITNLQPQINYNWMRGELVRWKTFLGHPGEGILYKPENFDPARKYPVILNYYERMSDGLNNYLNADFCHGRVNIPWFVSRGYLVFCPDISYVPGDPGVGIYDYVVSAAHLLAKKPWVDGSRMGIQGHSMAGFETNYLVTRTNIFAAAASSAGVTDMISQSGNGGFAGCAGQTYVEFSQFRMAVPFWQNLGAYIRNSAVFQVKKIFTPLLILQNKGDGAISWSQGVELFTALRRLGRPVWMLQYDGGGHNIYGKDAIDYTIRLTQYFDHYLKGLPEPKWMSIGVPEQWKGIDDGLEIP